MRKSHEFALHTVLTAVVVECTLSSVYLEFIRL